MSIIHRNYDRIRFASSAFIASFAALILPQYLAAQSVQPSNISYVLLNPGSQSLSLSGSTEDLSRARSLRAGSEGLLYFRQGGIVYVIRDPVVLRKAAALFAPEEALGAKQSELGSRQTALGREQSHLGAQQAHLGSLQANASPTQQDGLSRQQNKLGRQQDELGKRQNELGRQQGVLGREQEALAQIAEAKLRALIADAVRLGVAQRLN
jgi:bla regulator protein BlaR1